MVNSHFKSVSAKKREKLLPLSVTKLRLSNQQQLTTMKKSIWSTKTRFNQNKFSNLDI